MTEFYRKCEKCGLHVESNLWDTHIRGHALEKIICEQCGMDITNVISHTHM